jgi:Rps23 Pro-64 3,4-dihydroxylase Tpa1-like proline 4-hydroxylase
MFILHESPMFKDQRLLNSLISTDSQPILPNHLVSSNRLQRLVDQSFETLESLLKEPNLPPQERAAIALKILEQTGGASSLNLQYSTLPQLSATQPPTSQQSIVQKESASLPGDCVFIENFLSPEDNKKALEIALTQADQFVGSKTTTQAKDYRKSSILYATLFPDYYNFLRQKLLATLPDILQQLNHPTFEVSQVEMQLTAHNDGCFYKIHNDSGSEKTATRTITYVYYFHQEPKKFSGGELRLYETELKAGVATTNGKYKAIEPKNNSIVFFDSRCKHEVMPVKCPSRKFEDGRFALNGWLRRSEEN